MQEQLMGYGGPISGAVQRLEGQNHLDVLGVRDRQPRQELDALVDPLEDVVVGRRQKVLRARAELLGGLAHVGVLKRHAALLHVLRGCRAWGRAQTRE